MTPAQILAIVYLLLAFNVPQSQIDTVQAILQASANTTSNPQQIVQSPIPVVAGGIIQSMKPAYTLDQLLQLFLSRVPKSSRTGYQATPEGNWPVNVFNISSTTANIGLTGYSGNWGPVSFNGEVIITPIGYPTSVILTDLTPSTVYSYTFTWKEDGREDTIITKTFKTALQ